MKKPIKLYIPNYYDNKIIDTKRLVFSKTKRLLKEDDNNAKYIASLEKIDNYQCNIPEIGEYQTRATNNFYKDRKENWELQVKVSNCKVYTYNCDDQEFHFRIYWIVISEQWMLQLTGIFDPDYSGFYKQHFLLKGLDTEIDTTFNFSSESDPEKLFEIQKVKISVKELQERIDAKRKKEEKAKFLEENLKIANPNFYVLLQTQLDEQEEASIENFICSDWNMYYDLHNPENFSDPDSSIEWEDNSDVYKYYEEPYTNNARVKIVCNEKACDLGLFKSLIAQKDEAEQKLLNFFEYYTFDNGGAYADGVHYQYAKIEIERLHNTTLTNQEFLKLNLCLQEIVLGKNSEDLRMHFICSWDTEHGIDIIVNKNFECKAE